MDFDGTIFKISVVVLMVQPQNNTGSVEQLIKCIKGSQNIQPTFHHNTKNFQTISFGNNEIIILRNSLKIFHAMMECGLYVLRPFNSFSYNTEMFRVANLISNNKQKVSHNNETYLQNFRLGHISTSKKIAFNVA